MRASPSEPDPQAFRPFADLAREHAEVAVDPSTARLLERQAVSAFEGTRSRRRWPAWAGSGVVVAGLLLVAVLVTARRLPSASPGLTFAVNGAQPADEYVRASTAAPTTVTFSDQSEIVLDPGAAGRVEERTADGARVGLERGLIHCNIVHRQGARWNVRAGPFEVRVRGTVFDVEWLVEKGTIRVEVSRGAVEVTGPLAPAGVLVSAGQTFLGDIDGHTMRVDAEPPAAPSAEIDPPPPQPTVAPNAVPAPSVAGNGGRPGERSWARMVAEGNPGGVIDDAQAQGIPAALASRSSADLMALGDAARYAHRNDLASRTYLAIRSRFPGGLDAQRSAFFLGRLGEDGSGNALVWYQRYLDESRDGAYAAEALERCMLICRRAGDRDRGQKFGAEYLRRFPKGPMASTARGLLAP